METDAFAKEFTEMMDCRGVLLAQALAKNIKLGDQKKLLDIAGGSGVYACSLCAHNSELHATVLDKKPADQIAAKAIADRGFSDQVDVVASDMLNDPLPTGRRSFVLQCPARLGYRSGKTTTCCFCKNDRPRRINGCSRHVLEQRENRPSSRGRVFRAVDACHPGSLLFRKGDFGLGDRAWISIHRTCPQRGSKKRTGVQKDLIISILVDTRFH